LALILICLLLEVLFKDGLVPHLSWSCSSQLSFFLGADNYRDLCAGPIFEEDFVSKESIRIPSLRESIGGTCSHLRHNKHHKMARPPLLADLFGGAVLASAELLKLDFIQAPRCRRLSPSTLPSSFPCTTTFLHQSQGSIFHSCSSTPRANRFYRDASSM
jgi:hypothetical protein